MSVSHEKIPPINELTEVPEKMGDGITWYIHLATLKIYGFSHISNTWFPSYDKDFETLVMCRLLKSSCIMDELGIDYGPQLLITKGNNKPS
jgi:hypothetical protein